MSILLIMFQCPMLTSYLIILILDYHNYLLIYDVDPKRQQIYQMIKVFLLVTLLIIVKSGPSQTPIIGIYTQDTEQEYSTGKYSTYIASSYIKNIQMAGGQVVPIFYHSTKAQLDQLLPKLNGVFFPGGQMPIDVNNQWTSNTEHIFNYAIQQNLQGNPYPIWATCLGYETIMYLTSHLTNNMSVLTGVNGQYGLTCPQTVYDNNSSLLKSLSNDEYQALTSGSGTMYYHHSWAVLLSTFKQSIALTSFWKLISTSKTSDNVQFVATVEAKNFPFFMTQYHPEKNSFEWRIPAKRDSISISTAQHFIGAFMKIARTNKNIFPAEQFTKRAIYNYHPKLTSLDYSFVSMYIFDEDKELRISNQIIENLRH